MTQKQKTRENTLMEKRADTRSGEREMTVQKSSWSFRPRLQHTDGRNVKTDVPTLDKIARVYMRNQGFDQEHALEELESQDDFDTDFEDSSNEGFIGIYRKLVSYALTEEYMNSVRPGDYDNTTVELQPYLFVEMESATGGTVYASISDPFQTDNCRDLLSATQSNATVSVKYSNGEPVLQFGDNNYQLSHVRSANDNMSIEREVIDELDEYSYENGFIDSEYDGWAKIPVKDVYDKDDCTVIETESEDDFNWVFQQPVVWDETEDLVKLLETFANGDPEQLDHIYIRPSSPVSSSSSTRTREEDEYNWEVAVEEPNEDEEMVGDLGRNIITVYFYIIMIVCSVVISILLLSAV